MMCRGFYYSFWTASIAALKVSQPWVLSHAIFLHPWRIYRYAWENPREYIPHPPKPYQKALRYRTLNHLLLKSKWFSSVCTFWPNFSSHLHGFHLFTLPWLRDFRNYQPSASIYCQAHNTAIEYDFPFQFTDISLEWRSNNPSHTTALISIAGNGLSLSWGWWPRSNRQPGPPLLVTIPISSPDFQLISGKKA